MQHKTKAEIEAYLKDWSRQFTGARLSGKDAVKEQGLWFRPVWSNDGKESIMILEFRDLPGEKVVLCPTAKAKVIALAKSVTGAASLFPEGEETMSCICGCTEKKRERLNRGDL
ncbi:hypothetical protein FRC01_003940 [Tulasnella sp. 417]|nr:hypothetical protein FRC01_003940 [Tulasnella sp. 417]